jgi:hypothetical protein
MLLLLLLPRQPPAVLPHWGVPPAIGIPGVPPAPAAGVFSLLPAALANNN